MEAQLCPNGDVPAPLPRTAAATGTLPAASPRFTMGGSAASVPAQQAQVQVADVSSLLQHLRLESYVVAFQEAVRPCVSFTHTIT